MTFENGLKLCKKWSIIRIYPDILNSTNNESYDLVGIHPLKESGDKFISNDQVNPIKFYRQSLRDEEKSSQKWRVYNPKMPLLKYFHLVYKYYFSECKHMLKQRVGTLNLAFTYFTQICSKIADLDRRDIWLLVVTWLLLASKLDEIDDNLLRFDQAIRHYSDFAMGLPKPGDFDYKIYIWCLDYSFFIYGKHYHKKFEKFILK